MASKEAMQALLEEIKTAAGKSQKDVFYYLKADQALAILKEQPPAGECAKEIRELGMNHFPSLSEELCTTIIKVADRLDTSEASRKDLLTALEKSKEIFSKRLRSLREKQETAQENLAFIERRYWSGVFTEVFELRHEIEHMLDELKLNEFCIQMAFMPEEKREAAIAKAQKETQEK